MPEELVPDGPVPDRPLEQELGDLRVVVRLVLEDLNTWHQKDWQSVNLERRSSSEARTKSKDRNCGPEIGAQS